MNIQDILQGSRTRKDRWIELGYTDKQIKVHLEWERKKSKESRDRKKQNNKKNEDTIKQIKLDLLGNTFSNSKILSISPSTDGIGFWYKLYKKFNDGSSGNFRYFYHFSDYSKKEFIDSIEYL